VQALSAADLSLVLYVCRSMDPAAVFSETPCQLAQPVLLSLIQQLSANFDSDIELKHRSGSTRFHSEVGIKHYVSLLLINSLVDAKHVYLQISRCDSHAR